MGCVPNLPQLVGDLCEGKEKLNVPQLVAQIPERDYLPNKRIKIWTVHTT